MNENTPNGNTPLFVSIEETREKIINDLNTSGLPIYLLEMILKDMWIECKEASNQFKQIEILEYQKNLKLKNEEPTL